MTQPACCRRSSMRSRARCSGVWLGVVMITPLTQAWSYPSHYALRSAEHSPPVLYHRTVLSALRNGIARQLGGGATYSARGRASHKTRPSGGKQGPAGAPPSARSDRQVRVSDHPTSHPRAATPQRLGFIGMVITASMNHQSAAFDLVKLLDPRRQHRVVGGVIAVHVERRQVAQMAVTVGACMLAGALRIVVTTRCLGRDGLTVLFRRIAAAVLMHMEAMHTTGQGFQVGGKQ